MTIADVLMKRRQAGLTQREVARRLGWNPESLTDMERARFGVTADTLERISSVIDGFREEQAGQAISRAKPR